ncbi:MAG: hypothetical protein P4L22_04950 [Candidatus Babeliales bacterium]|nr:hypothetical protein [Candidatus Babeliales bacterium]
MQRKIFLWILTTTFLISLPIFGIAKQETKKPIYNKLWVLSDTIPLLLNSSNKLVIRDQNFIKILDINSGKVLHSLKHKDANAQISTDNQFITTMSCFLPYIVKTWDLNTGKLLNTLKLKDCLGPISSNNKFIITHCYTAGNVKIWNLRTGKLLHVLEHYNNNEVKISPNNKFIITESNRTIKIWDITTGRLLHCFNLLDTSSQISYDGRFIVIEGYLKSPSFEYFIKAVDINTGQLVYDIRDKGFIKTSFESKYIISHNVISNIVKIWDINAGKLLRVLNPLNNHPITSITISPDHKFIVTTSKDKTAKVWDMNTGKLLHILPHNQKVYGTLISTDNKFIITYSHDYPKFITTKKDTKLIEGYFESTVINSKIWDAKTGRLLQILDNTSGILISNDSKFIVTGNKGTKIWKLNNV